VKDSPTLFLDKVQKLVIQENIVGDFLLKTFEQSIPPKYF